MKEQESALPITSFMKITENWTFTEKSIIHSIKSIDSNAKEFQTVLLIDDFDGDGKPDFFIQKELDNIITYFIEWGDSSVTSINFEHEISWISAFDLDNNGFLDLRICNIVGSQGIDEALCHLFISQSSI